MKHVRIFKTATSAIQVFYYFLKESRQYLVLYWDRGMSSNTATGQDVLEGFDPRPAAGTNDFRGGGLHHYTISGMRPSVRDRITAGFSCVVAWCPIYSHSARRYSVQYSCIHTGDDKRSVWGQGWEYWVSDGVRMRVHLAMGGIKAKFCCSHFKALRTRRWAKLPPPIPCQSPVSIHSSMNWGINERYHIGIP